MPYTLNSSLTPVSKDAIDKMRNAYEKTLRALSTANLKTRFPDRPEIEEAQSAWISVKDLQQLINDNKGCDGLRIYFGCHVDKTKTNDFPFEYQGLHNLIFVTTKSNSDTPTADNSTDNLSNSATTDGSFKNMAGDKIPLCPPNCPPGG